MNKKLFIGLVLLMSLALLGIIGMQYFWFRNSVRVKQAELNLSVNEAMRNSALKLENRETLQKLLSSLNSSDSTTATASAKKKVGEFKDFKFLKDHRTPDIPNPEPIPYGEFNEKNLQSLPPGSKYAAFSGVSYKYSVNIDSVAYAEELRDQIYRFNEHLRHENEEAAIRKRNEAIQDSIQRRNREKVGDPFKPAPPKRSKIIIDGKEIREPSINDIIILRKVIGEYYHSRPNDPSRSPNRSPLDVFRAELSRSHGRLPDSILKFKLDSFIKVTYKNPTFHLSRADIIDFERRYDQQLMNQGFIRNNIRIPFSDNTRFRGGRPLSIQDSLVQKRIKHLTGIIDQIILEVSTDHSLFNKRLSTRLIDSVLINELKNNGVMLKPEYAVYNDLTGKESSIFSPGYVANDAPDYTTRLFPDDLLGSPYSLKVQFKNKDIYILKSMTVMLSMAVLLTVFLILAFIIALWAIIKQKKITEIRSDFINNITHEFKTPISTIGLAIDSIDSPKVIENKQKVQYFTKIIREENYRMNQLVENVLRAALLDQKTLKQNIDDIDLHELILKAINHTQLQIESRNGTINLHLDAENSIIEADSTQVLNAILNLIDNAIKYSKDAPYITISTRQSGNRIICSIEDKGIGINHEIQRRIFDRFYRYTDGNIHDVKGHGLGLSFVKAIVDAHNGRISVESELGKGSRFDVIIPLKSEVNEE
ncbi:MAG: HAMP domain-containing sensor histidine kinase [Bacteroidota bacterium]|nr:HAMP domain-containing sensor histidine kinase [Bacteroidota bacterium]